MAAHAKLYYLPRSFLIRLLDELTDDELNELACDVSKNDLVDISCFFVEGFKHCINFRDRRNMVKNSTDAPQT